MDLRIKSRTTLFSWLFVGALLVVCAALGVLQYRWISAVNVTAGDHMREGLRANLLRVRQDFSSQIAAASSALGRFSAPRDAQSVEAQLLARLAQWKQISRHPRLFDRVALVVPGADGLSLRIIDFDRGVLTPASWPAGWTPLRGRLERTAAGHREEHGPGTPPQPGSQARSSQNDGLAFEIPVFASSGENYGPGRHFGPREREIAWVVFNLNLAFIRQTMLPELLRRDLGVKGSLDYQVEVVARDDPDFVIFQSDPGRASVVESADASVALFDPPDNSSGRRGGPGEGGRPGGFGGRGGPGGPPRGPSSGPGRWQMYVRHRAGSLEAVVEQTRLRNLSVTAGVLLLMLATAGALLRFTIRSQRLAGMQMDFVAGVSHELRTPLAVIHTAGYNLQGKLARNPAQVEQYGAMIQRESARLRDLVEQVLRFSSAGAGRVVHELEPLSVARVIEEAMEASRPAIDGCACVVESNVDDGLPPVLGDPQALRQALENLVGNALKYGAPHDHWIGIFATKAAGDPRAVEIRVADHGPGIPEEEQRHIFDPFFRGARALRDQIHGTGLGLSLVKKIVEAHGGSIRVESAPLRGTEFIMRIPAAPEAA
jgi:signal transduction histidine kinase